MILLDTFSLFLMLVWVPDALEQLHYADLICSRVLRTPPDIGGTVSVVSRRHTLLFSTESKIALSSTSYGSLVGVQEMVHRRVGGRHGTTVRVVERRHFSFYKQRERKQVDDLFRSRS